MNRMSETTKNEMDELFATAASTTTSSSSQNGTSSSSPPPPHSVTVVVHANSDANSSGSNNNNSTSQVLTELQPVSNGLTTSTTTAAPTVTTVTTNGPGPGLQKVVLEDIRLEDYYNETMEESLCKQFKFQITNSELKIMIENSVLETNTAKPYRYLTGNFIRVFERHVEMFEKQKIPIQKRNNVVYEESLRNNTVYMRINGDCKLCPKANRVRYVFIIKQKPEPEDKYVEVEAKIRGTHIHDSSMVNTSLDSLSGSQLSNTHTMTKSGHSTARKHTQQRLSLSMLNNSMPSSSTSMDSSVDDKTLVMASVIAAASSSSQPTPPSAKRPRLNKSEHAASQPPLTTTTTTIQLDPQLTGTNVAYLSTSPKSGNSNAAQYAAAINLLDKNFVNQIANQISGKIMIKLEQINLKVNQISDRLYDLERKLDSVEVAEIQF